MTVSNPYRFGIPLSGGPVFVGRSSILKEIFAELSTDPYGAKLSLYGARNIGTTSVLLSAANPVVQSNYAASELGGCKFLLLDLKELPTVSPRSVAAKFVHGVSEILNREISTTDDPYTDVRKAADLVDSASVRLVVLLDEADRLVEMGSEYVFMDSFLYAILNRSGNNLNMITASKKPLYELFTLCQKRFGEDLGSPYFVHFRPVRVGLFEPQEAHELIVGVSSRAGLSLEKEFAKIRRLGGTFPHFLQIACSLTFRAKASHGFLSPSRWREIRRSYETQAFPYHTYFWENFTDFERQVVVEIATENCPSSLPVDSQDAFAKVVRERGEALGIRHSHGVLAFFANDGMIREMKCGGSRGEELSEWLWSLLQRRGNTVRLFSDNFRSFVRAKATSAPDLEYRGMIPALVNTLHSNLRRHFRSGPPQSEADVQQAVQLVLDAGGYQFTREGEQFPFSLKGWRPDHSSSHGIAIEVKLCKSENDVKRIVEEISADVLPYRSRFQAVVIVVYDLGSIHDELRFRQDFEQFDGLYVLIRKH